MAIPEELQRAERLLAIERLLAEAARDQRDILREISNELGGQEKSLTTAKKQYSSLRDISNEILRNEESETKLTKENLDKLKSKARTNLDNLKTAASTLATQKGIVDLVREDLSVRRDLTDEEIALLRAAQQNFLEANLRFSNSQYLTKITEIRLKELSGTLKIN